MLTSKRQASGTNFFSSFLDASVIDEDDLGAAKAFVKGSNRFEISESDTLNENERQLTQDLNAGQYKLEVLSMGNGKFGVKVRVRKASNIFFSMEKVLSGRGKHAVLETEFVVTKENEPATFDLFFKNKSHFWQKASYYFKLVRINSEG
jgi:hypothetical protein